LGNWGDKGDRGQNIWSKVPYLESSTDMPIHYATFMGLQ